MARLALSPVPSNGLVVLLMLLSGTAPPAGLLLSLSATLSTGSVCSLHPPPVSHFLPRSPSAALGPECVGISSGVCDELRGLHPTQPAPVCIIRLR